ncbi:MAG: VWA domain-containing protein [Betaproteobacteria bacterium]|nr:MAG: VWA domain-containing protein [Betaproteobacteria bacterium]
MTFLWPEALVAALVVPAFLAFYARLEKRKRTAAMRTAGLYPFPHGHGPGSATARHAPLALFLASLAAASLALGRPQAFVSMFAVKGTVVIAVDVSGSMKADDSSPSRLARSRELAREFVAAYSDEFRIGLVSFGTNAVAVLDPTTRREDLQAAIDQLALHRGTAIGSGIAAALAMLFPDSGIEPSTLAVKTAVPASSSEPKGRVLRKGRSPGSYSAAAIILISDGESTAGPDPIEAARLAAKFGVRVHTLGMGSSEGKTMRIGGWSMRVRLDEAVLKEIAALTHGEYFHAVKPVDWPRIRRSIRPDPPPKTTATEITALFAAAGAAMAVAGALLSLLWRQRVL